MLTIIDGGNSTYLRENGYNLCPILWSAPVILENPDLVKKIHHTFINSGSQCITTFNYSCTPYYSEKKNFDYLKAIEKAGQLAKQVKDESSKPVKVLGCIPPYSESYRQDLIPDSEKLTNFYRKCIDLLEPNVDIFLCETLSSINEAELIINTIKSHSQKPIWISFTVCNQNTLRCGYPISNLIEKTKTLGAKCLLFNCTPICLISDILRNLNFQKTNSLEIGVYPNLHDHTIQNDFCLEQETNENTIKYSELTTSDFSSKVEEWINEYGITVIGGCCGVGPDYIKALETLKDKYK